VFDSFSIVKDTPTAVEVANFAASSQTEGIRIHWQASGSSAIRGFNLYRALSDTGATVRLNVAGPIVGGPEYSFLDRAVEPARTYDYKLAALDATGQETFVGSVQATAGGPVLLKVRKPKPNPFERSAELAFSLPRASRVRLTISDVHGRKVRELLSVALGAGEHSARWDGKDDRGRRAATGIYFATLDAGGTIVRTRLALLR